MATTVTIPDTSSTGGVNYQTGLTTDVGLNTSFGFSVGTTFVVGMIFGIIAMYFIVKHKVVQMLYQIHLIKLKDKS